jgi:NAD(P)-dependent dehydrogenase (short-subunit alcohol dehydrogenase family)
MNTQTGLPLTESFRRLHGRTAVITGGSGVLCKAVAKELAKYGVNIAILNRNAEKGNAVAEEIRQAGGTAIAVSCDVMNVESIKRAEREVMNAFGSCEILINGAGGGDAQGNTDNETLIIEDLQNDQIKTIFDITPAGFEYVLDLNLSGTWLPIQIFSKHMIQKEGATIINFSSMASSRPATKVPAYSAAKAAVENMTKWLAVYFADAGIRVNALAPGFFLTEQNRKMLLNEDGSLTKRSMKILSHTPMRRFGVPKDLLGTVLWLVNEEFSGFVTGAVIPVDGGFLAYSGV